MVVISTGASIFQVNASQLRRPSDTVDLEELPDSRERTGTPVLWLLVDVKEMFGSCSLTINSFVSAILDRQGLLVATPVDLRTKKAESVSPQLLQGFWSKLKRKNPEVVVLSPTVTTKTLSKKKSHGNSTVCAWPWQSSKSLAVSIFIKFWDQNQEGFGGRKSYDTFRRSTTADGPSCVARDPCGFSIILAISYVHLN